MTGGTRRDDPDPKTDNNKLAGPNHAKTDRDEERDAGENSPQPVEDDGEWWDNLPI